MATRNEHGGWDLTTEEASDLEPAEIEEVSDWEPSVTIPFKQLFDRDHCDAQRGIYLYACIICGRITPNRITHLQTEHGATNVDH
jgi:hypothetical protein